MKDRILKAIFILTILFILYISFAPYIIIELWRIQSGKPTAFQLTLNDIKDDIDNTINKSKYNKLIDDYIKKRFGETVSKNLKIINNDGYRYKVMLNDIMDKVFYVQYEKNSGICLDNFNETAFRDEKFQHLYSNWVKKQVGIDDENVELYFNRASCGSRNIGENIYIDFRNIISLDNLEEQICENTHNLYIRSNHHEQGVDIIINNIDNIKEVLNYADLIEEKIRSRIFIDTNHFMPSENNHLFICILTQKDENYLVIKYDYDSNIKKYRYLGKDSNWIEYE